MMKKTFVSLLILALFLGGCSDSDRVLLDSRPAVVVGKVEGESNYVNISFHHFLHRRISLTQGLNPEDRTFEFILYPYHAQDAEFTYQNNIQRIFISPGDTLYVVAKMDDTNGLRIEFEGKKSRLNREIQLYSDYCKEDIHPTMGDIHRTSAGDYLTQLQEVIYKKDVILDAFIDIHRPSVEFIDWAGNDMVYSTANNLMDYKMNLVMNGLPRNDSLFRSDLFPVYHKQGLVSSMYGVHLWHYTTDRYIQQDARILEFFEKDDFCKGYDQTIKGVLENEPKGIIRDIMVFRMLTALMQDSPVDLEEIRNKYASSIENEMLRKEVALLSPELEAGNAVTYKGNDSPELPGSDIYDYLLEESKKQLLYVDIWATWCGPCRAEMPQLKLLHEKIKNENIRMISICCDTKKNDWLAVIEDNDLPGQHFLLNGEETKALQSNIPGFEGFPTYLIIKNGVIVDRNAERPSSGDKIIGKLKSHLSVQ